MKKALLTLAMVCALPISSLNARWYERMPILSSWMAVDEPDGVPGVPAESSEKYKELATPVIEAINKIKTEKKRQVYIDLAKQNALCAAARAGVMTFSLCLKHLFEKCKWKSPLQVGGNIQQKVESYLPKPFTIPSLLFVIATVRIANYAESAFSNWMQAQRYEKQDKEELREEYHKVLEALANAHKNDSFSLDEQVHMDQLRI